MKLLVLLALVAFVAAYPGNEYSKYDDFDVDTVVNNERLLGSYMKCFCGTGKCTSEGKDFKEWIPDAVQSGCGKCTDKQKVLIARVMKASMEKVPEQWEQLNKIHNPDGKYDESLKEFLGKYGN